MVHKIAIWRVPEKQLHYLLVTFTPIMSELFLPNMHITHFDEWHLPTQTSALLKTVDCKALKGILVIFGVCDDSGVPLLPHILHAYSRKQ
jgi:hypothetical protein